VKSRKLRQEDKRKTVGHQTTVVYICASGHSGSTLLDLLLGSHPLVTSLGEVGQFTRYFRNNDQCTCKAPVQECSFWLGVYKLILNEDGIDLIQSSNSDFASFMWGHARLSNPRSIYTRLLYPLLKGVSLVGSSRLLRSSTVLFPAVRKALELNFSLFDAVARVTGSLCVVDSSKSLLRMKLLFLWHPKRLRIVHLVRDGRAVMASRMRKRRVSARVAARAWAAYQRRASILLRTIPKDQQRIVRYEDLCDDSNQALIELCSWLKIPYDTTMLNYTDNQHHNLAGNRMRFDCEGKIQRRDEWKSKLTQGDLAVFGRMARRVPRSLRDNGERDE